jgi:hypothetical protein
MLLWTIKRDFDALFGISFAFAWLRLKSGSLWYEHFGFEIIKEITLPIINLPMWEMTRGG